MKRQYPCGADKRRKQKQIEESRNKQKGSLLPFFHTQSKFSDGDANKVGQNNTDTSATSSAFSAKVDVDCAHAGANKSSDVSGSANDSSLDDLESRKSRNDSHELLEDNVHRDKVIHTGVSCESETNDDDFGDSQHNEMSQSKEWSFNQKEGCKRTFSACNDTLIGDIALWPDIISDKDIDYYITNKPNHTGDIKTLKCSYKDRNRFYFRRLQESHFYRIKSNGLKEKREWMIYSATSKCVYCYVCKLFPNKTANSQNKLLTGFCDWKNVQNKCVEHETSKDHISAMCTFSKRSANVGLINSEIAKQLHAEEMYWREVLKRVVATVKLLAKLGLGFRGQEECLSSTKSGNYLSCLQYLSEFDDFLKNHLKRYSDCGQGNTSYLSHQTCDEFIAIMAEALKVKLVNEVKKAVYYSIIIDSTPDVSHIDQLTLVIRYISDKTEIKEKFFGFIPISCHTSKSLEDVVLETLSLLNIDIKNCRGQTYDNAANMAGKYGGLQARIKAHAPKAFYIPCASHSLNLVGNCAADSCFEAVCYFQFVQNLFTFFSASTQRWNTLANVVGKNRTLKRVCSTRWSARADAVSALKENYRSIKNALLTICNLPAQKPCIKVEATSLMKKFDDYETKLMTSFWSKILARINAVNLSLQDPKMNVLNGSSLLLSIKTFIQTVRDDFQSVENEASILDSACDKTFRQEKSRIKKRKIFFDEGNSEEVILVGREAFICEVYFVVCDTLISEIDKRVACYNDIINNFKVFFDTTISDSAKHECIETLMNLYNSDVDCKVFKEEVIHFLNFCAEESVSGPFEMYRLIANGLQSTFPNVETVLKNFLTMPISNASGERTFSALKRIKNYLRNKMGQSRLSDLSLLNIESGELDDMNYEEIIRQFASRKCRKARL